MISFLKDKSISANFLHIYAIDDVCLERMVSRLECYNCGSTFNLISKKPQVESVCDICNSHLVRRKGDDYATAVYRLQEFHQNIEPVINNIKQVCPVLEVNTSLLSIVESSVVYSAIINKYNLESN